MARYRGKYTVTFKKSVAKDLRALPNRDVARILKRIDSLTEDPRTKGCIKLSGQERYRVRQGEYRIIYEIRDDRLIVHVVKVAHRARVYS
ncbi:MAG: mRNA interferase RelE/StbE [Candidatus Kentron sp. G]|nr:MAG: mRNA interferase RelE/StbE [Candidatus Kentron sp. G]VFN02237.1 MAG: mRNA interferase RelE/StbE [Candidatus Kentron sp. G]VFN03742.1 MAG: mRNA interferase RelE/StbE [Candidatus Kentron sp. G]